MDKKNNQYSRRSFLKMSATCTGASLLTTLGVNNIFAKNASNKGIPSIPRDFFWSSCIVNCGSSCVLRMYAKDGRLYRVETDNILPDDPNGGAFQVRACPRGRSMRDSIYSTQRLRYPMKRVGPRGSGKFERISWDEAFQLIAEKIKTIRAQYGNEALYTPYSTGIEVGIIASLNLPQRFLNACGGFLRRKGDYSSYQNWGVMLHYCGTAGYCGNPITDLRYTKLAVFFGLNTAETRMSGGGLNYELQAAKAAGNTKIIIIDPRYSDSCVNHADEWIPIRVGTDAALASALAYVLITENMVDMDFIKQYVSGFDSATMPPGMPPNSSYSDYILGIGYDGIPKTPEWASPITGIPASRIYQLAREIGQAKPCFITQGWGVCRQANGEMNTVAICALAALTGNVGIRGGGIGDRERTYGLWWNYMPAIPALDNPVTATIPAFMFTQLLKNNPNLTPQNADVTGTDKITHPIKFILNYAGNCIMNQHSEINTTRTLLADESICEMIVTIDTHMTATAQWSDILLPSTAYPERKDITSGSYSTDQSYLVFTGSCAPFYESKDLYDIFAGMAKAVGDKEYNLYTDNGKTSEDWLHVTYEQLKKNVTGIIDLPPTLEEAREVGLYKAPLELQQPIPFEDFRKDPKKNPLKTPSGKLELFSTTLYALKQQREPLEKNTFYPVPQYVVTWDGYQDEERKKDYPFQLIGHHFKGRTHSSYGSSPWLKKVAPQTVWINDQDAKKLGIQNDDLVRIYNDRGATVVSARVTPRIIPQTLSLPEGAWYTPDKDGTDMAGCINVTTSQRPSAIMYANPSHTNRVMIERYKK